jgi:predicted ABC-type ATPase
MTEPGRIIIIAGPNGAGKTTFAREFLPQEAHCPDFINADLIAAGLSPFDPELAALQAGRLMLQEMASRVAAGRSFAIETTLSGLTYARQIPRWRNERGCFVKVLFLALPDAEMAVARVAARIAQGVPRYIGGSDSATLRRRLAKLRPALQAARERMGALRQFRHHARVAGKQRQPMNPTRPDPTPQSAATHDADLLSAADALRRAAVNAQELARRTGTPCYVWLDGRVVNIGAPVVTPAAG